MTGLLGRIAQDDEPKGLLGNIAQQKMAQALLGYEGMPAPVEAPQDSDFLKRLAAALTTMPSVQAVKSGFTLPGDVYAGRQAMPVPTQMDQETGLRVADMAGLAGTGGFAGTAAGGVPAGAVGIFGGRLAKTADHDALAMAEALTKKGADRKEILDATGWFQGADGKWRFEIPDNAAKIGDKAMGELTEGGDHGATQRTVAGVLHHKDLYEAYPQLRQLDVDARYNADLKFPHGSFNADPGGHGGRSQVKMELNAVDGESGPRSLMLHELQHGVQTQEGFARGANVAEYARGPMFDRGARDLAADLSKELTGGITARPPEIIEFIKYGDPARIAEITRKHGFQSVDDALGFLKAQDEKRTPFDQYRRTSGEVEARNVQGRRDMTPEERRARPPWETEDTPRDQQIVRYR